MPQKRYNTEQIVSKDPDARAKPVGVERRDLFERQGTIVGATDSDRTPQPKRSHRLGWPTDGRFLLVDNPIAEGCHKLAVTLSNDGWIWHQVPMLEDGLVECSYPTVIQSHDALVRVTCAWKQQRIQHVVLDPPRLHG